MTGPIPIHRRRGPGSLELSPATILRIAIAAVVILGAMTSWYQVGPESQAVVRRLGRYAPPNHGPGVHFKLPFGIDKVDIVQVQRQLKEEFGFRTISAGVDSRFVSGGDYERESLMLTGDLNVAVVEWTIQYRITDPYRYLFKVRNPKQTFRFMAQAVMREVVGDRTVTEVLTVGRAELAGAVQVQLQEMCVQYDIGLRVDQVILQDVTPPVKVKPSFNEVNQAQQQKERRISEARSEYNRAVPQAEGEALQAIEQAKGFEADRINRAKGDAERFLAVATEYAKAPAVTRRRLYLEAMGKVLPQVGRKIVVDGKGGNLLQVLNLDDSKVVTPKAGGQ